MSYCAVGNCSNGNLKRISKSDKETRVNVNRVQAPRPLRRFLTHGSGHLEDSTVWRVLMAESSEHGQPDSASHLGSPSEDAQRFTEANSEAKSPSEDSKTDADACAKNSVGSEAKVDSESEAKSELESEAKPETGPENKSKNKVTLLLKAAGDAPIMKQKQWMVDPMKQVTWVIQFIRRYIKLTPEESLFVYVSQAFSPAPDQTIGNLLQCFGSEGKLVLHYCKTQAWG